MMKINLSGDKDDNKDGQNEDIVADSENATVSDAVTALTSVIEDEPNEEAQKAGEGKPKIRKLSTPLLAVLLVILVAAVGLLQKDFIMGFFTREAPVIETVAPPPPPPPPEPKIVESEPDPAFVALNSISESVTPQLWLTSTVIKYDGSYELKGMAFNHKSITDMAALLANMGTISKKSIPGKMKSAETVYRFSIDGVLRDVKVPEILDTIPADQLIATANAIKGSEKAFGIKFSRLPKPEQTYTDKDLPFSLEGSYEGLKKVISLLCPENGTNRVFRITVAPSSPGRSFDKIQASFSIKTISSI